MAHELELDEDGEFQRKYWKAQRAGWVVLTSVLAAAALGLFGGGPASEGKAGDGGFTVEYSRFLRRNTTTPMVIHLAGAHLPWSAGQEGEITISLNSEYARRMSFQQITPQPKSVESAAEKIVFHFRVNPEPGDLNFYFEAKPRGIGRASARISAEGFPDIQIGQFVYP